LAHARHVGAAIELFDDRPAMALALARDGAERCPDTAAAVACMGVRARAAARADVAGALVARLADEAVSAALGLTTDQVAAVGAWSPDAVSPVEIQYHALLANIAAGNTSRIAELSATVVPALESAGSRNWLSVMSVHLSGLDIRNGDLDAGIEHVRATLSLTPRPFRAVARSVAAFVVAAKTHGFAPLIRPLAEEIRTWHESAPTGVAGDLI
jgi:hypothetical protein